jgi:crossover junction endodeoxyribonuclease RuvC
MTPDAAGQGMRVLGVDTSLRSTGVGVVERLGHKERALVWGVIRNPPTRPHTASLAHLYREISNLIAKEKPDAIAIEGIFFSKNPKTAMILGQARGVVLAVASLNDVPVYEYSPRLVKQSVVGVGSAHKSQVGHMIKALLAMNEEPVEDAADALALALCHLHQIKSPSSHSKTI